MKASATGATSSASGEATAPEPTLGVYVHFPWCLQKCPYCDFLSIAKPRQEIPHKAYADATIRELRSRNDSLRLRRVHSVFFGGGTPSLWEVGELSRVLDALKRTLDFTADVEVTVECNPSSFSLEVGQALRQAGVNRLSLGVQALDGARLEFLGRLHDGPGGLHAVQQAIAAGFSRVSADLIYGVYGQDAAKAEEEVATVAELGVSHLSAYALTIEPGTAFGARARKGTLPLLAEGVVADSFVAVRDALGARLFHHYETSNFARPGHECRHNLGYWRGEAYLGLGCGAWGTLNDGPTAVRYRNTPSPERYLELDSWADPNPFELGLAYHACERLDANTRLLERFMLGLRLSEGVDLDAVERELGIPSLSPERRRTVEKLIGRGELELEGSVLRVSKSAWLFADRIIRAIA
jgi:putative oxygen-independent coproporphyrinogen III oxidase